MPSRARPAARRSTRHRARRNPTFGGTRYELIRPEASGVVLEGLRPGYSTYAHRCGARAIMLGLTLQGLEGEPALWPVLQEYARTGDDRRYRRRMGSASTKMKKSGLYESPEWELAQALGFLVRYPSPGDPSVVTVTGAGASPRMDRALRGDAGTSGKILAVSERLGEDPRRLVALLGSYAIDPVMEEAWRSGDAYAMVYQATATGAGPVFGRVLLERVAAAPWMDPTYASILKQSLESTLMDPKFGPTRDDAIWNRNGGYPARAARLLSELVPTWSAFRQGPYSLFEPAVREFSTCLVIIAQRAGAAAGDTSWVGMEKNPHLVGRELAREFPYPSSAEAMANSLRI